MAEAFVYLFSLRDTEWRVLARDDRESRPSDDDGFPPPSVRHTGSGHGAHRENIPTQAAMPSLHGHGRE